MCVFVCLFKCCHVKAQFEATADSWQIDTNAFKNRHWWWWWWWWRWCSCLDASAPASLVVDGMSNSSREERRIAKCLDGLSIAGVHKLRRPLGEWLRRLTRLAKHRRAELCRQNTGRYFAESAHWLNPPNWKREREKKNKRKNEKVGEREWKKLIFMKTLQSQSMKCTSTRHSSCWYCQCYKTVLQKRKCLAIKNWFWIEELSLAKEVGCTAQKIYKKMFAQKKLLDVRF